MSYQFREQITINKTKYETQTEPLKIYEDQIKQKLLTSRKSCSALWRNYVGYWEVDLGRLYLTKIQGLNDQDEPLLKDISFEPIFGPLGRVFADWFSGEIIIPKGRIIHDDFYECVYEFNAHYEFTKGIMTNHYCEDNRNKTFIEDPF